jgi:spore maturation protein SpmA
MLNGLFVFVVLASILTATLTGGMQALTDSVLSSARNAIDLAFGLIGVMAFFLGLMRVLSDSGLMATLARTVSPVMKLLFPSIPAASPAMSAMILNIAANMMGLANAATPFGIKAITELNKLNSRKGTATNDMVLFLAINTAGLAVLPSGMIAVRAALGSTNASGIFFPTWFASGCATVIGITAALLLARLPRYRASAPAIFNQETTLTQQLPDEATEDTLVPDKGRGPTSTPRRILVWLFWVVFLVGGSITFLARIRTEQGSDVFREMASYWLLPAIIAGALLYGWSRRTPVYDSLVEGAKEGFDVAIRIIPYLVAILVAVGMFRACGALEVLTGLLAPITSFIGMPAEALPMALLRPLTGSGALGVASEAMTSHGPDSLIGYMVSTYQGSTETTFYVLAVYYGAVGVKNTRHTIPACLIADITGILAATLIVNLMFG